MILNLLRFFAARKLLIIIIIAQRVSVSISCLFRRSWRKPRVTRNAESHPRTDTHVTSLNERDGVITGDKRKSPRLKFRRVRGAITWRRVASRRGAERFARRYDRRARDSEMTAGRLLSDVVSVIYDETRALLADIIRDRLITRNHIIRIARFAYGFLEDSRRISGFLKISILKKIQISSLKAGLLFVFILLFAYKKVLKKMNFFIET